MEDYKKEAKEFCDSQMMIDYETQLKITPVLKMFIQYLLYTGKVVETTFDLPMLKASYKVLEDQHRSLTNEHKLLIEKYNFCREEMEEDRKGYLEHVAELESTVSSAGKEIPIQAIKPNGSAKETFDLFWETIKDDNISNHELASLSFDEGHALRHKKEDSHSSAGKEIGTINLKIDWTDEHGVFQLTNKKGDTYTSKSEELADFLLSSEDQFKSSPASTEIKEKAHIIYSQWVESPGWTVEDAIHDFADWLIERSSPNPTSTGYASEWVKDYFIDNGSVKVISEEEIKKYLISYYSDRPEVQNLHLAAIRAINWYREQLTKEVNNGKP